VRSSYLDQIKRVADEDDANASDTARQEALESRLGCGDEGHKQQGW